MRQNVAKISDLLDNDQILARLDGSRFMILSPDTEAGAAKKLAKSIIKMLESGLIVQSINATLDASIGYAIYPEHGTNAEEILRRAAIAKNDARLAQRPIRIYENGREASHIRRLSILGDLQKAADNDELQLYLQPKINVQQNRVCGAEALVRWEHPHLGNIMPQEFVPLAESAGSISVLSEWVLCHAVQQCHAWQSRGIDLPIAINLSPLDLLNKNLPEIIWQELRAHNISPDALNLEITEEAAVKDFDPHRRSTQ